MEDKLRKEEEERAQSGLHASPDTSLIGQRDQDEQNASGPCGANPADEQACSGPTGVPIQFHRNGDTYEVGRIVVDCSRPDTRWSASILPFCTMPDGTFFFLLGKEMNQKNGEWCGFGGQHENYEHDPVAVAAREWEEELLFCGTPDRLQMQHDLVQNQYHARVVVCLNEGAGDGVPRNHLVTYLKQVPWSPDLPSLFKSRHQHLTDLHQAFYLYESSVEDWLRVEKQLADAEPPFTLPIYGRDCVTWVVNVEDDPVSGEQFLRVVMDNRELRTAINVLYLRCYGYYRNLRDTYTRIPAEIRCLPCIRYRVPGCPSIKDASLGLPYVPSNFLEKTEIAWFSNHQIAKNFEVPLPAFGQASRGGGYMSTGNGRPGRPPTTRELPIRRNFLCTLYSALEILGCLTPRSLAPPGGGVRQVKTGKKLAGRSNRGLADSSTVASAGLVPPEGGVSRSVLSTPDPRS